MNPIHPIQYTEGNIIKYKTKSILKLTLPDLICNSRYIGTISALTARWLYRSVSTTYSTHTIFLCHNVHKLAFPGSHDIPAFRIQTNQLHIRVTGEAIIEWTPSRVHLIKAPLATAIYQLLMTFKSVPHHCSIISVWLRIESIDYLDMSAFSSWADTEEFL